MNLEFLQVYMSLRSELYFMLLFAVYKDSSFKADKNFT